MTLLVDTSVWSLALRRDTPQRGPEVNALVRALERGDPIVTTGLVLQELLQGFSGPKSRELILEQFSALPVLTPDREDHIAAAELRNTCRRSGLQIGTIDALIAQFSVRYSLTLLTMDQDFLGAARFVPIKLWRSE